MHKKFWRFSLLIIIILSLSCSSSNQENVQENDNDVKNDITVQGPIQEVEEESEKNSNDGYYMNMGFVVDSQCDLTDKYFNLDNSDQLEEEDENIYLLSIKSGHHPTRDLTVKKISHQHCYHGYPSSSDIECVFEKDKLVLIDAVCDSLFEDYNCEDPESHFAKYQYRYYFDNGDLLECHKREVHGIIGEEDSLLAVFKKQEFSPCECKEENDEFLLLIRDILGFLGKNKCWVFTQ